MIQVVWLVAKKRSWLKGRGRVWVPRGYNKERAAASVAFQVIPG